MFSPCCSGSSLSALRCVAGILKHCDEQRAGSLEDGVLEVQVGEGASTSRDKPATATLSTPEVKHFGSNVRLEFTRDTTVLFRYVG